MENKPAVQIDTKTRTYTEKDFKEMVNGWNEEREILEYKYNKALTDLVKGSTRIKELEKENEDLRYRLFLKKHIKPIKG
jgi:hypothetical protein